MTARRPAGYANIGYCFGRAEGMRVAGESEQAGWVLTGLAPGSVIAGYRVESRVGAGGMAMVFRARDQSLGRTVALKVLAPALADDAAFRERFIRESRAAAVVDHPHIIPVYGAGEFGGVLYIAMRFVAGGDLRALLQREGRLAPSRAAFLLSPLASALDAGHAAGLVHRDVKPANVLIDTSPGRPDHLYLSDFGLAKGTATSGLTGTGQFLGTLEYCAPEQIEGKPARPQTDQYALGCVAYTMFTGAVPFPREEATAVLWAHMSAPPPQVTALRPDLPPAVDPVIARAMAKDPGERYPACADFVNALRAALGVASYTSPSQEFSGAAGPAGPPGAGAATADGHPLPVPPAPVTESALSVPPAVSRAPTGTPPAPERAHRPQADATGMRPTVAAHSPTAVSTPPGRAAAPRPARFRPARRAGLAAAAAAIVIGGGVAAVLAWRDGSGSPPGSSAGQQPGLSPGLIATLADPSGASPNAVAFESNGTLVTADTASNAYQWAIATQRATAVSYASAAAFILRNAGSAQQSPDGALNADAGTGTNQLEVTEADGSVFYTVTVPQGTTVIADAFSPDSSELAAADSDGRTYVWRLPRQS